MSRKLTVIILIAAVALALSATGCAEEKIYVDYDLYGERTYGVEISEAENYCIFTPQAEGAEWAFLFYLGTAMLVANYDDILTEIAATGITVVVSPNPFPDIFYDETEKAYSLTEAKKFFIGGHSQGGGAAVRRACENPTSTYGCVLYSPLISNDFTLADKDLPVLFFEAENDKVLSSSMKTAAKERMSESCEFIFLEGANHMVYGTKEFFADGENDVPKADTQAKTVSETVRFFRSVIRGK